MKRGRAKGNLIEKVLFGAVCIRILLLIYDMLSL